MAALNPRLGNLSNGGRQVPEDFGRYRIIKQLGQGGMGSVYLAQDTHLGRPVALKVPDFGNHEAPEARRRFLEEARTAATLDHPYLCRVYETGEIEGQPYLTMAYIEGQSLAALVGEEGWPQRQVAALMGKLALALQEAHARKVVHRDLKPANVMIKTTSGRREPVIVDFGLARRDNRQEQRLTKSGQIMGTLGYMAPEQIRGELNEIGPACDIYALGVILYELLTGLLPFSGSGLAVAGQILTRAPLPPSTHRSDLDPALEAICLKAMAKAVGDRYTSMAELAAALTGFLLSSSLSSMPAAPSGSPAPQAPTSVKKPQPARSNSLISQFLAELAGTKASPPPIPTPQPVASRAPSPERGRRPWPLIVTAAVLGFLMIGVIMYVAINTGRNKIEVNGPKGAAGKKAVKPDPTAVIGAENKDRADRSEPTKGPGAAPSLADRERTNGPIRGPKSTPRPAKSSAESLFNGSDLKGWEFDKGDVRMWRVENRTLVAVDPDGGGQGAKRLGRLLTERSFKEFIIRFEYQSLPDFEFAAVWWTLPGEMPPLFRPTESVLGLGTNRRGQRLVSNSNASELKGGEGWNMVEVEARDRLIRISVNGKETVRRVLSEKPAEPTALKTTKPDGPFPRIGMDRRNGRVGFEVNGGTGRFRNIEIDELPPSPVVERPSPKPAVELKKGRVEEPAVKAADLPKTPPAAPDDRPNAITNSIGMNMVLIPAGKFLMGSPDKDMDAKGDETPPHPVRITRPFYLGVTEVTRGQFRQFVDEVAYQTEAEKEGKGGYGWNDETKKFEKNPRYHWQNPGFEQTDAHPAVMVSWNDTVAFTRWLSRKQGKSYRLPTEAEWEYACRAGTRTRFSNGDQLRGVVEVGNAKDRTATEKQPSWGTTIAARDGYVYSAPVGRFQPNAFGLYDMHGNAEEWCSDGYDADYYQQSPVDDPPGASRVSDKVIRGGAWYNIPPNTRSAGRWHWPPDARVNWLGFRVALVSAGP